MQHSRGPNLDTEAELQSLRVKCNRTPEVTDFGAGDVVRLINPQELHYGCPQDWVTTGVGKVIVGGARLGYGSNISGGDYLIQVGGRRLWAKEHELSLLFAEPRLSHAEEIQQEQKRREIERQKRLAELESGQKRSRARLTTLEKKRQNQEAAQAPRDYHAGEEQELPTESSGSR